MITSVNNGQVKNIIQLNQKQTSPQRNKGFLLQKEEKMFGEAPRGLDFRGVCIRSSQR